jgi:DHA1 family tetracycline resistance protein-like MFS transporter
MEISSDPIRKKGGKKLFIIFIILFTETLGFTIVIPVLPFLAGNLGLDPLQVGLIMSIFSFCQLFASPITGKLSDRFGRKPILLFSQFSTFIGFFLLGIANSVWILILARLVDGLLGSNMTVSQAYISDVTEPKDRTKYYGYSSAVFGSALIFGPLMGGLLSNINYSAPMFLAAGISLISIFLVIFFLPESLDKKDRGGKIKIDDILPIKEAKKFFSEPEPRNNLILFFIYSFGFMIFISTFPMLAEIQFDANPQEVGYYLTWVGILRVLLQFFLVVPILKKFGENKMMAAGIWSLIICMVIISFSNNYWVVFIPLVFLGFGTGVCRPILSSRLSKSVKKEETGSIMGVNNALNSFSQIMTPIIGGAILTNLPSILLPVMSAVIFFIMFIFWRSIHPKSGSVNKE